MAARFLERGTELLVHAEKPGRDHYLDVGSARAGRHNEGCEQGKQVSEISRHGTAPQMRPGCNVHTKAARCPAPYQQPAAPEKYSHSFRLGAGRLDDRPP